MGIQSLCNPCIIFSLNGSILVTLVMRRGGGGLIIQWRRFYVISHRFHDYLPRLSLNLPGFCLNIINRCSLSTFIDGGLVYSTPYSGAL